MSTDTNQSPVVRPESALNPGPANDWSNHRILIIDDDLDTHAVFSEILTHATVPLPTEASSPAAGLPTASRPKFTVNSAAKGSEGLSLVRQSLAEGQPFALAFVDIRMAVGWDGFETAQKLWQADPELQIVLCTAFSDYSWEQITKILGPTDNLLVLKKPFDSIELLQMAHALTKKWSLGRQSRQRLKDLDRLVHERTLALSATNEALLQEIAERIRTEETLRATQSRLQLQFDHMPLACITWDRHLRVNSWNPAAEQIFGYTAQEALGKGVCDFIVPKHLQPLVGSIGQRLLDGQIDQHTTNENLTKDNRTILCDWTSTPLRNAGGEVVGALSMVQDVTEHKQLEEQMRQAQKMEAVGQLAGGVAHDFNNLLTVMRGHTELVLMDNAQLPAQAAECLRQVIVAAERAANLTRQLLAFGRKQLMQPQPLNLNDVIGTLNQMLNRIMGEDIQLQCDYVARLPFVQADPGMIEQVVVNLALNARDAMPCGGRLLITIDTIHLAAARAQAKGAVRAGEFVCLSVSDTGTGISPQDLPHLFEPFFTTKAVGKGSGLGLATVYGIIKQHQGWIEVSSELGKGSVFELYLPAIAPPQQASTTTITAVAENELRGGSERILLVEDDYAVRVMTQRVLETYGYRVWPAMSGRKALEVWHKHGADVDLLLTDIVMPDGLTGRDLAHLLRGEQPNLKVIFMSGYSADLAGQNTDYFQRTESCFLQKPWSSRTLIEAVRRSLDGK
jgi:PAS domain S-box-containing protein